MGLAPKDPAFSIYRRHNEHEHTCMLEWQHEDPGSPGHGGPLRGRAAHPLLWPASGCVSAERSTEATRTASTITSLCFLFQLQYVDYHDHTEHPVAKFFTVQNYQAASPQVSNFVPQLRK